MDIKGKYNVRSPAVKRLMREAMELYEPTEQYFAQPVEDNLFEWHFTVRGAPDTDFANGIYHGRILLPPEYPMKPPSIILLTPNGRFEIGKKICLSMSAHHPETWQPSWSIRTVLLAIIGFMPSKGEGAIGALEYTSEERRRLAKRSMLWVCPSCGSENATCLREGGGKTSAEAAAESMKIADQISFKSAPEETDGKKDQAEENETQSVQNDAGDNNVSSFDGSGEGAGTGNGTGINSDAISTNDSLPGGIVPLKEGSDTTDVYNQEVIESVRKRIVASSQKEGSATNRHEPAAVLPKKESNGIFSLVLLWIVVLSLVILIFRRLCMDAMSIGGSK